jgi:hypothetical protein
MKLKPLFRDIFSMLSTLAMQSAKTICTEKKKSSPWRRKFSNRPLKSLREAGLKAFSTS